MRVFDEAGEPIPRYDEIAIRVREQERVQAVQARELAEETVRRVAQERENAALRAELERLRDKE